MNRLKFGFIALTLVIAMSSAQAGRYSPFQDSRELRVTDYFASKSLKRTYNSADEAKKVTILKGIFSNCWRQPFPKVVQKYGKTIIIEDSREAMNEGYFSEKDLPALSESARSDLHAEAVRLIKEEKDEAGLYEGMVPVFRFWYANAKSLGKERQFIDEIKKTMIDSSSNDDLIACLMVTAPLTPTDYEEITQNMLANLNKYEDYPYKSLVSSFTSEILYHDLLHVVVSRKLFPEKEMAKIYQRISQIVSDIPAIYSEPEYKKTGLVYSKEHAYHVFVFKPTGKIITHKNPAWNNAQAILRNIAKRYPGIKDSVQKSMTTTTDAQKNLLGENKPK